MKRFGTLLWGYCKKRRWHLFAYFGCCLLLACVYHLYRLPWGPALYTLLLTAAFLTALFAIGFHRYLRRMHLLEVLVKQAPYLLGELPEPACPEEEAYQELLHLVEERAQAVQAQAEQKVKRANQYYALWSHQVKTPLAAMRLLLQDCGPERDALGAEVLKIEQYVEMALQYQRLRSPSRDLVLCEVALQNLARGAVKRVAPLIIHKRLQLEFRPLEGSVLTDPKWLCFVLEQILTNAVKYTPSGGRITVFTLPGDILAIRDTGVGIRAEDLPLVCEWGYTGYNGRQESYSTGVGLALCRETLQMLGHSMKIESEPGVGTTVFLLLHRDPFEMTD